MEVKEEPNPKKEARQVLKEQIAQALAENKAVEKLQETKQNEPTPS